MCFTLIFPIPPLFFMNTHNVLLCDRIKANIQECFELITFHLSNCCIFRVKTMWNNSKIDRGNTTNGLYITENIFKKSYQFLECALAYLLKRRYAPVNINKHQYLRTQILGTYARKKLRDSGLFLNRGG